MEFIESDGLQLALVYREKDWQQGVNFFTPHDWFLQAGNWQYEKDRQLRMHKHHDVQRTTNRTQELVFVKRGKLELKVFGEDFAEVKTVILNSGDLAVLAYGGHEYKILEEGTQVLEVKNGPYHGDDKVLGPS